MKADSSEPSKGLVCNIQHHNVHDGEGFRTVVFLQDCNLRCRWRQNPETQSLIPVMLYDREL